MTGSGRRNLHSPEPGETLFTNPGLVANQSKPNLVTCIITRPNGSQFEAVGLLTPAG
jgi:hypothetical protein